MSSFNPWAKPPRLITWVHITEPEKAVDYHVRVRWTNNPDDEWTVGIMPIRKVGR